MPNFSADAAAVGVAPLCLLIAYSIWSELKRTDLKSLSASISIRSVLLIALVSVVVIHLYRRWKEYRRVYHLIEKIPGPPCHPIPFLGHGGIVLELDRVGFQHGTYALIYQMLTGIHSIYAKEKLIRMWMGSRPFVLLFTPEAVEVVLSSNVFTDKSVEYMWLKPWLGEGLVTSNRSKWKQRRKALTPAFHFRILEDFLPIINEQAHVLVTKVSRMCKSGQCGSIDILPLATLCTLDTICETAMGIRVGAQHNESDYVKALHQVSGLIITRLTRPWLWPDWSFHLSSHGRRFRRCLKVMKDFTNKVIRDRRQQWIDDHSGKSDEADMNAPGRRLAFLDLLLEQHLVNNALTLEDIREEVDTFMFAGHDTTAMAISWTLYMLGLHQDIQERVREEVDEIFAAAAEKQLGDARAADSDEFITVSTEMMREMKYLDCVLKEVQRVYPTAPFIGRDLTEDAEIAGYTVPKGSTCGILTFLLHRNAEIFPNPEVFDPDRFRPDQAAGRHPYAYVPFSAGPRNCVGQRFALMEQKIVVANMVRRFHIRSLMPRDKLIVVGEMVLRPQNGLHLEITPRFKSCDGYGFPTEGRSF